MGFSDIERPQALHNRLRGAMGPSIQWRMRTDMAAVSGGAAGEVERPPD